MNSRVITNSGIFFLKILSLFPFWLIYLISDFFYFLICYVIRYRKNVIINNLKKAFPEKPDKERRRIMNLFYRYFSDLLMESIKMRGMKEKDFRERFKVKNPELLNQYLDIGKSVILLTMHYSNWEWGTRLSLYQKYKFLAVYKPLHNMEFDRYMIKTRSTEGNELIKNSQILRRLYKHKKKEGPVMIGLVGDQTPPSFHTSWYQFLNQEAIFYPGPASLSKQFNLPIFFYYAEKNARGKYTLSFETLIDNPEEMSETDIIKTYIRKMEEVIKQRPEYYLWSHKRWKHRRPANKPLHG